MQRDVKENEKFKITEQSTKFRKVEASVNGSWP